MLKYIVLILIIVSLYFSNIVGQSSEISYEKITSDQPTCIVQDTFGFVWIGTEHGLLKYDGYKVIRYTHYPQDTTSISSNWITAIKQDLKGNLYIGTKEGGLNYFNQRKGAFRRYKLKSNLSMTQSSDFIKCIEIEDDSLLWIGTEGYLISLRIQKNGKAAAVFRKFRARIYVYYSNTNRLNNLSLYSIIIPIPLKEIYSMPRLTRCFLSRFK